MSTSAEQIKIDPALATSVRFAAGRLHVALSDGREISVPIDRFPRLLEATAQARDHWEITAFGTAIRWRLRRGRGRSANASVVGQRQRRRLVTQHIRHGRLRNAEVACDLGAADDVRSGG